MSSEENPFLHDMRRLLFACFSCSSTSFASITSPSYPLKVKSAIQIYCQSSPITGEGGCEVEGHGVSVAAEGECFVEIGRAHV